MKSTHLVVEEAVVAEMAETAEAVAGSGRFLRSTTMFRSTQGILCCSAIPSLLSKSHTNMCRNMCSLQEHMSQLDTEGLHSYCNW